MNKARIAAAGSLLALAALCIYYTLLPDPRMADGALDFAEATVLEVFLIMSVVVAIIGVWLYGVVQLASLKRWGLFWLAVVVWPTSHAYLIFRKPNAR